MDKVELISLALDQLIEQFHDEPNSFDIKESEAGTYNVVCILWEPRVELDDSHVHDPNNHKAVMVTYNYHMNSMKCIIFNKSNAFSSRSGVERYEGVKADASVECARFLERWRSNHKKFCKLRGLIAMRDKRKENREFLKKLHNVFPGALDKDLFGK